MKLLKRKISIPEVASVSSEWMMPDRFDKAGGTTLILAHGAAHGMDQPFLKAISRQLALKGLAVIRFNFPYMEAGTRSPDSPVRLKAAWLAVLERVRADKKLSGSRTFMAGKSLGGRVASEIVAEGGVLPDGLVLLGYPLHAPGRPDRPRYGHFEKIGVPSLWVQGSRDALCDLDVLWPALKKISAPVTFHVVKGGDHSYRVPKSLGREASSVWAEIAMVIFRWTTESQTVTGG